MRSRVGGVARGRSRKIGKIKGVASGGAVHSVDDKGSFEEAEGGIATGSK
jgi:dihydroorotase-like cyclic amidohydrolase